MTLDSNATTSSGGTRQGGLSDKNLVLIASVAITAFVYGIYSMGFAAPALLDEQFLLEWLSSLLSASEPLYDRFFDWSGFRSFDHWGLLTHGVMLGFSLVFAKNVVLWRLAMAALQSVSSVLLMLSARKFGLGWPTSLAAAVIFASFPLSCETVVWIGSMGALLGGTLTLGSLLLYLHCRAQELDWRWLSAALVLYVLALTASTNYWFFPLVLGACELAGVTGVRTDAGSAVKTDKAQQLTATLVPLSIFIILTGVYMAATGFSFETLSFKLAAFGNVLKDMFLPVNQGMWHRYSKQYRTLYILWAIGGAGLAFALWKGPQARKLLLLTVLWLPVSLLPAFALDWTDPFMAGCRLLYLAAVPLSLLFATACFGSGVPGSAPRSKPVTYISVGLGTVLALALVLFYVRHVWDTSSNYREWGRLLKAVQKSMATKFAKDGASFYVARDMPKHLSVDPIFSQPGPRCFDAKTGLLRSNPVPDGKLKQQIRENEIDLAMRWENNMKSFIPLDLAPGASQLPEAPLYGNEIAARMQPGLAFCKNASLSKDNELVLDSNSDAGPMITIAANELSPVDGDYLWIEACIDAPASSVMPRVEMQWQTYVHPEFDRNERYTYANAVINDKKYHHYLLSLRSNGWTTCGRPSLLAFGFPSGSKVSIRRLGIQKNCALAVLMPIVPAIPPALPSFTPPYYNYPNDSSLGLVPLPPGAPIEARWDNRSVSNAAAGILIEVSRPDATFDDANSDHQSSVTYRTYTFTGATGQFKIPRSDLMGPGVYSVRGRCFEYNKTYSGFFSDPVCYQVPK